MEHRTTYEQFREVDKSLKRMHRYLSRLQKHVEHTTPGDPFAGWIGSAIASINGATANWPHWSGGMSAGAFTGWEAEETERYRVERIAKLQSADGENDAPAEVAGQR
jgi:hypothetical protein